MIDTLTVDGCYIWNSEEGPGRAVAPPSPLVAVPNVTAHLSMASVSPTLYYLLLLLYIIRCGTISRPTYAH